MITCQRCGDTEIKHYRQIIAGGKTVITARCANGHIPEKGKPFYPKAAFDIASLPLLMRGNDEDQLDMFDENAELPEAQETLDMIERHRQVTNNINNLFPRV